MGCCCSKPQTIPYNTPPKKKCTDIIFLIFFILFNLGLLSIVFYAFDTGAVYGTWYGWDSNGHACGFDNTKSKASFLPDDLAQDNTNKKYRMCLNYQNLVEVMMDTTDKTKCICVEKCPGRRDFSSIKMTNYVEGITVKNLNAFVKLENSLGSNLCLDYAKKKTGGSVERYDLKSYDKMGSASYYIRQR